MGAEYGTIVADPPWQQPDWGKRSGSRAGNWNEKWLGHPSKIPYPTLSLAEIQNLPVSDLAAPDAHLYLWTTNYFLRDAFSVVEAWGFEFSTLLTWCKAPMGIGLGGTFVQTTEHILFARRGSLKALKRVDSTWWEWKRTEHSRKPETFLDLVESVSPGPYLELFARRNRLGWDTWGNEALNHVEIA